MKIGIFVILSENNGGIYQYTVSLIESLLKYSNNDISVIKSSDTELPPNIISEANIIQIDNRREKILEKIFRMFILFFPKLRKSLKLPSVYEIIERSGFDIIVSPLPSIIPMMMHSKYITTFHDFQHKYYPEFFTFRQRIFRELLFKSVGKYASRIICESRYVVNDIKKYVNDVSFKSKVLVCPPPKYIIDNTPNAEDMEIVKKQYHLPEKYLFYPAQFWPHKNHVRLVESLRIVRDKYDEKIMLILIGSKMNGYSSFLDALKENDMAAQVVHLGYVDNEHIPYLYQLATILVMPTLFESVSLPIWEAFILGCPVVASNICALPEQVGDAGILFDPLNCKDMAQKIYQVWSDNELRGKLVKRGYVNVKDMTLEKYAKQWDLLFNELQQEHR